MTTHEKTKKEHEYVRMFDNTALSVGSLAVGGMAGVLGSQILSDTPTVEDARNGAHVQYIKENGARPKINSYPIDLKQIHEEALDVAMETDAAKTQGVGRQVIAQILHEYTVARAGRPLGNTPAEQAVYAQLALNDTANLDTAKKSGMNQDNLRPIVEAYLASSTDIRLEREAAFAAKGKDEAEKLQAWQRGFSDAIAKAEAHTIDELNTEVTKGAGTGAAISAVLLAAYFLSRRERGARSTSVA